MCLVAEFSAEVGGCVSVCVGPSLTAVCEYGWGTTSTCYGTSRVRVRICSCPKQRSKESRVSLPPSSPRAWLATSQVQEAIEVQST